MGNAVTDDYHDYVGTFEYWWTHGLISDSTYETLQVVCDFGSSQHPSKECEDVLNVADVELGDIDHYSIFTPTCKKSASESGRLRGHYVSYQESAFQYLYQFTIPCSCLLDMELAGCSFSRLHSWGRLDFSQSVISELENIGR